VIIPACDEEEHIGALLTSLQAASRSCPLRIVVVCNGCTDATEAIARSFDDVEVLVSEECSKHTALNAGDEAAKGIFPRFYVDGDVGIDPRSMRELIEALETDTARGVGPSAHYDLANSPWLVRAFFRTSERLPFNELWHATHLQGRGLYGTNRQGRARFDRFPAIRSDDGFFDLLFDDAERAVVSTAVVELACPASTGEFLRNQTRVIEGYKELMRWMRSHYPDRPTRFAGSVGKGWWDVGLWWRSGFVRGLRRGSGGLDAVGYVVVDVLARGNALRRQVLGRAPRWR
jgi:glycosyltransferase involved in cell wall biosynthesis